MWAHVPCRAAHVAVGFRSVTKVSKVGLESESESERHLPGIAASNRLVVFVSQKLNVIEIDCYQVRRELSDYLEGDVAPELRTQIEAHLRSCNHCTAVYDGIRNVMHLLSGEKVIELPAGFSRRLYERFRVRNSTQ